MLRNFRKDGHNWKKKNDGKIVKEAHEHLKVGNEERIHVYYAHDQPHPAIIRFTTAPTTHHERLLISTILVA
ncbi:hypothetical protein RYX36_002139 [Vicia faba]